MNRTKIVYLNTGITLFAQLLQIVLGFVVRKTFIDYLGVGYLGYNSVFQNILQMLNLADLGIGVAVTSFLYKPLANNEKSHVYALMHIYKSIYRIIGVLVLLIGIVITLIIPILIPDATCSNSYLRILFVINLIGTCSTYYLAYRRTLLIAEQKTYIVSLVDSFSMILISVCQIIVLSRYSNYVIYLLLVVVKNIFSNLIISYLVKRTHKMDAVSIDRGVIEQYIPRLKKYVKDVFVSRIGAVIYYSTDNIIISFFKGSLLTGYLSNYTMISSQVIAVVTQLLSSVQATYGNFINTNRDKESHIKMTDNYLCIVFIISNWCMLCFFNLIQPFINIFFGEQYAVGRTTVVLLSINLFFTIMLQLPSQIFMVYKLYKYDKPIIIISAILNVLISIILVQSIAIDGVLIGTLITSLFYLISRFVIVCRYVFKISFIHYLYLFLRYFGVSVFSCVITYISIMGISGLTFKSFILRTVMTMVVSFLATFICVMNTNESHYLVNKLMPSKILTRITEKTVKITSLVVLILFFVFGIMLKAISA